MIGVAGAKRCDIQFRDPVNQVLCRVNISLNSKIKRASQVVDRKGTAQVNALR